MELDIFIPSLSVAIEYDGAQWHKNVEKDIKKDEKCCQNGVTLIRIRESDCPQYESKSIKIIIDKAKTNVTFLEKFLVEVFSSLKKHNQAFTVVCIDLENDYDEIVENAYTVEKTNSLAFCNKELALEWDYEKNGNLTPEMIPAGSQKKVWWKCSNNHSWSAVVSSRNCGNGCPYCSGKRIIESVNDLATLRPDLVLEWDFEKNGIVFPNQTALKSNKKIWWKCSKGHSWQATVASRSASNNPQCPYCINQRVLVGFNDLATTHPELLTEWDYDKNVDITPQEITAGNDKKVWWKCKHNHSWRAVVESRSRGCGCPYCVGKKAVEGVSDLATLSPELTLEWDYEKNHPLLPTQVTSKSSKKVWWKCCNNHSWNAVVSSRIRGNGCPYCAGQKAIEGINDLATLRPELISEWDYEKNYPLLPTQVAFKSSKKVWWKCEKGHSWPAVVSARTQTDNPQCPYCINRRVLEGFNDLATNNPELLLEWDYEKNVDITPQEITVGSEKKVWWKCTEGHSYQAMVSARTIRHTGCKKCYLINKMKK